MNTNQPNTDHQPSSTLTERALTNIDTSATAGQRQRKAEETLRRKTAGIGSGKSQSKLICAALGKSKSYRHQKP